MHSISHRIVEESGGGKKRIQLLEKFGKGKFKMASDEKIQIFQNIFP